MCDFIARSNAFDGLQPQAGTGFEDAGIGIAGVIGKGADFTFRIHIVVRIITKAVLCLPGFTVPVAPHLLATYDTAFNLTDGGS